MNIFAILSGIVKLVLERLIRCLGRSIFKTLHGIGKRSIIFRLFQISFTEPGIVIYIGRKVFNDIIVVFLWQQAKIVRDRPSTLKQYFNNALYRIICQAGHFYPCNGHFIGLRKDYRSIRMYEQFAFCTNGLKFQILWYSKIHYENIGFILRGFGTRLRGFFRHIFRVLSFFK